MRPNPLGLTARVYLTIKHRILTGEYPGGAKLPRVEELAEEFGVNQNTVKHALSRLKDEGLIEPVRKAGTRVSDQIPDERIELYVKGCQRLALVLQEMASAGFSILDLFACFAGAVEGMTDDARVYYVDLDAQSLLEGKKEIEEILGIKVYPVLIEELEAIARIKKLDSSENVVITTFQLEGRVRSCLGASYIIPMRTAPPIDQLFNFQSMPADTPVYVVARSEEEKFEWQELYGFLAGKHPSIRFVDVRELESGEVSVEPGGVFIMSRYVFGRVEKYLRSARQVIAFGKFTDPEGFFYVREALKGAEN